MLVGVVVERRDLTLSRMTSGPFTPPIVLYRSLGLIGISFISPPVRDMFRSSFTSVVVGDGSCPGKAGGHLTDV